MYIYLFTFLNFVFAQPYLYTWVILTGNDRTTSTTWIYKIDFLKNLQIPLGKVSVYQGGFGTFDGISSFDHQGGIIYWVNSEEDGYVWTMNVSSGCMQALIQPYIGSSSNIDGIEKVTYDSTQSRIITVTSKGSTVSVWSTATSDSARSMGNIINFNYPSVDISLIIATATDTNSNWYMLASNASDGGSYYMTKSRLLNFQPSVTTMKLGCSSGPGAIVYPQYMAYDPKTGLIIAAAAGTPNGYVEYFIWFINPNNGACVQKPIPTNIHMIVDCWVFDPMSRQMFYSYPVKVDNPSGSFIYAVNVDTMNLNPKYAQTSQEVFPNILEAWSK